MKFIMERVYNFKIKANNPKRQWLEKDYPGFLHTIFMQGIHAGVFEMKKLWPFGFRHGYSFNGGGRLDWFWDLRDLVRARNLLLLSCKKSLSFFLHIYNRWCKDYKIAILVLDKALRVNYSKLSDQQLFDLYEKVYQANIRQGASGYMADTFLASGQSDWFMELINQETGRNDDRLVSMLARPVIPSYNNEALRALKMIARRVGSLPRSVNNPTQFLAYLQGQPRYLVMFQRHCNRYYWVENNYFAKVLNWQYFAKQAYHFVKNRDFTVENFEMTKNKKRLILRRLHNRYLARVVRMSELATHMQDYRKMTLVRFSHFLDLIFNEMSRRTDLSIDDFRNVIEPEMYDVFIKRSYDKSKLRARAVKNFCFGVNRVYGVYEGNDLKKYVNESEFKDKPHEQRIIRGVAACPGLVVGLVRIVKDTKRAVFRNGEILVTNNTTPEFVPFMKRARAIITEQGGITTHAAIISRELKVPCIIGTGVATKVLRDGDRVEVDAFKGIIRRL